MNNLITFYSYKGGVGRSMSLANTAVVLSKWGYKVLIVDWDLEAPGLEQFFRKIIKTEIVQEKPGVIDLLGQPDLAWTDTLIPILLPDTSMPIHLISSGKRDEGYFKKVRDFNIDEFYGSGGGQRIENLRQEWKNAYDLVLIDSRTGITEVGGICTVQLPDLVVLLFTATHQGFDGTLDVARRALKAQQGLPFTRQKLVFLPIVTKFDTVTEFKLSQEWITIFADGLKEIYDDWLSVAIKRDDIIEATKIPYISYFSFGEKLPVLEQSLTDRTGLAFAYETLAGLLANSLENIDLFMVNRADFMAGAQRNKEPAAVSRGGAANKTQPINVFISYSSADREFKRQLMSNMSLLQTKYDLSVWSDDDLLAGDDLTAEINRRLNNADIMLALISPYYVKSAATVEEFALANKTNKRIVPIIIEPADTTTTPVRKYVSIPRNLKAYDTRNAGAYFSEVTTELEKLFASLRTSRGK